MSMHRMIYTLTRINEKDGDAEEFDVECFYTAEGGCAPHGYGEHFDPGSGPEIIIDGDPKFMDGTWANLTDEELLRVQAYIEERHEPEPEERD